MSKTALDTVLFVLFEKRLVLIMVNFSSVLLAMATPSMRSVAKRIAKQPFSAPDLLGRAFLLSYLYKYFSKLYFCSYTLADIYGKDFFSRYRKFVDWGFCAPVAAMSMLALKANKTTRYVFAYAGEDHIKHCWVEFRLFGTWYAIDPLWTDGIAMIRRKYYEGVKPEIIEICNYQKFWDYQISHDFLRKMSNPQTSWLLWELMMVYGFAAGSDELFRPDIATTTLDEEAIGRHINVQLYYYHPEVIFTRRIIHQMMQHPTATRPKAHTVRHAKTAIKKIGAHFEAWLIEHGETQFLRQAAAQSS